MADTSIEWTQKVWNPLRGCSRVSDGCKMCYAERFAARFGRVNGHAFEGLSLNTPKGPRWTGEVRLAEDKLDAPLRWKKPRRIFVNSMSDLFHEKVPDAWIARIFSVMGEAERHTFQVLTKRPERMLAMFSSVAWAAFKPLPNVWLGVSVEDQATSDERIPLLLQTPAAVRWVSYEPALGPVDFGKYICCDQCHLPYINWIVIGGESGPGARPFNIAWARNVVSDCAEGGPPVFVKQLGACAVDEVNGIAGARLKVPGEAAPLISRRLKDPKGKDPSEWPEDLRVREYPR